MVFITQYSSCRKKNIDGTRNIYLFADKHIPFICAGHPVAKLDPCQIRTYDASSKTCGTQEGGWWIERKASDCHHEALFCVQGDEGLGMECGVGVGCVCAVWCCEVKRNHGGGKHAT